VPKPERQYKVGDRVQVTLHTGRIVDAIVKAVVHKTDGTRLQVDYERDQTALVELWGVHPAK
jgi:transcriptional regulator